MPSLEEAASPQDKALEFVEREIAKSNDDRVPTSRQKLSHLVFTSFGIPLAEATKLVDEYCDEKAPGVPYYLQEEFESPYLKVMAVVSSIAGIGVLWNGANLWHRQKSSAAWFIVGALLVGAAGYSWFKTIQQEISKKSG